MGVYTMSLQTISSICSGIVIRKLRALVLFHRIEEDGRQMKTEIRSHGFASVVVIVAAVESGALGSKPRLGRLPPLSK